MSDGHGMEIERERQAEEDRLAEEGAAMLERCRILQEFSRRWEGQYDPLNRCPRCGSLAHFEC